MKKILSRGVWLIFTILCLVMIASCQSGQIMRDTVTLSVSQTPANTPTPSPSPTITPQRFLATGEITYNKADDQIPYDWYGYIPKSIDPSKEINIWITGVHGNLITDTYNDISEESRRMIEGRIPLSETSQYVLLVPVIPRPQSSNVYAVSFPRAVFLDQTWDFVKRPDEKVILMIDQLIDDLEDDHYQVNQKVIIDGFSAGAMFAQRFTLLHPDRVQAMAAGQCGGGITLPLVNYGETALDWPLGINDFSSLVGSDFDLEAYQQVPQFIFIGDQDVNNSTVKTFNTDVWESSEVVFLDNTFGSSDPVRLQNQVEYLIQNGFENMHFRMYTGVAHSYTDTMILDVMNFFTNHDLSEAIEK